MGIDITHLPIVQACQPGHGYLSHEHSIFRQLPVCMNLIADSGTPHIKRAGDSGRPDQPFGAVWLTHVTETLSSLCSGGEKRKLEIARALVTSPKLIHAG